MSCYKQIIINLAVDDDVSEKLVDELAEKTREYVEQQIDGGQIKIDSMRVN